MEGKAGDAVRVELGPRGVPSRGVARRRHGRVVRDGDLFEHATHVTCTIIGGKVVFDRAEYLKLPFARRALPLTGNGGVGCCLGSW